MSTTENETPTNDASVADASATESDTTPTETPAPAPPGWSGPSEREWSAIVGGFKYLKDQGLFDQEEEEEPDYESMDLADLTKHYVDGKLQEVRPYVEAAAREAGEKRMGELLDEFEKRPEVGRLDKPTRNAVGFVAESILGRVDPSGSDPQAAVYAVYEAAKMLGGLTKSQRDEAVAEFKESFKKTPYNDPNFSGAGERSATPATSYEEVISRYTGDEEV